MSYVVLARKWRPKRFAEMVGQEHVLRALTNPEQRQSASRVPVHRDPRRRQTTVAHPGEIVELRNQRGEFQALRRLRHFKEIDEGRFIDLIGWTAASLPRSNRGYARQRAVLYRGRYRRYLIDEVHMLSNHSF